MKAQSDKGGSQITFSWMLFVGLMLVAANLRAPFTGVAPVQDLIQLSYNLSAASVGLLTTLPLMAFAVVSPFAATISRRFGVERTLVGAITFVIAGILLRSLAPLWGLYTGTVCIGIGIAIGNVLLPSLIKRDFPGRVPTVTGMSTVTMGLVAALVSVSIVPMASAIGWRAALSANLVFAVLPLLVWMARLRTLKPVPAELRKTPVSTGVWRSPWRGKSPCSWGRTRCCIMC
ncbi:MFS transporter [Paenalcaligenes niemegkensis]|uniref:MFS transporter n=1 Tax=Paenalcaligenes niemegkensis TaxID=2895469 RepID=UPI001EE8088F|nr:MFS transporter [Paenalcaligenes niemegkensis]MCQ9616696.1 MFS transporter [Paenalcaligenes niemegkensis]